MASMKYTRILLLILVFLGLVGTAAAVDQLISLQGKVTQDGVPVDDANLVVTIWNESGGGTENLKYNSTTNFNNKIQDGFFDVMLGSVNELDLNYNQYYWLDLSIDGQDINWSGDNRKKFESVSGDTTAGDVQIRDGYIQVCSGLNCLTISQNATDANISSNVGDIHVDPYGSASENNTFYIHGKLHVTMDVEVGEDSLIINGTSGAIYWKNLGNESGLVLRSNGTVQIGAIGNKTVIPGDLQIGEGSIMINATSGEIYRHGETGGLIFGEGGVIQATGLFDPSQGMYERRFVNPAEEYAQMINGILKVGGYETGDDRMFLSDQYYKNINGLVFEVSAKQTGGNRVGIIICADANPPNRAYFFYVYEDEFWVYEKWEYETGYYQWDNIAHGDLSESVTDYFHRLKVFVPPGGEDVIRFYVDGGLVFTLKQTSNYDITGTSDVMLDSTSRREGRFGMIAQGPDMQEFLDPVIEEGTDEAFNQQAGMMLKGLEFFYDKDENMLNWTSGAVVVGGYTHLVNAGSTDIWGMSGTGKYLYVHLNNLYGYESNLNVETSYGVYETEDIRQDPHNIILGYMFGGKVWMPGSYVGAIKGDLQVDGQIYSSGEVVGVSADYVAKSGDTMTGTLNIGTTSEPVNLVVTGAIRGSSAVKFGDQINVSTTELSNINGSVKVGTGTPRPGIDFGSGANADLFIADDIQIKGSYFGKQADYAEVFPGADDVKFEPGDVVVIDLEHDEQVTLSSETYQTTVAGVVSTEPGMLLGAEEEGVAVALAGRVPMKVTKENGSIKRGDLLTTSSTPGHAMKCENRNRCSGSIVGKALEDFDREDRTTGMIKVLVALA